jgi:anthranilate synthase/aminodeoxychorismate synthase-like glutamine amidotransferase
MSILIIDNFDSFTFNLFQLLSVLTDEEVVVKRNNALDLPAIKAMEPTAIVLSPGPGHPANDRDFGVCRAVLESAHELKTKVLGICLGHQGMVQHLGGNVIKAPKPVHGKMSELRILKESPIFRGIQAGCKVMRYHSLVAQRDAIPASLEIIADESIDELVLAVQSKDQRMFGLQFHPESIGTAEGKIMMENFLAI